MAILMSDIVRRGFVLPLAYTKAVIFQLRLLVGKLVSVAASLTDRSRCITAKHLTQLNCSASERYFLKAAVTPSSHNHIKSSWIPSPSPHRR